MNRWLIQSNGFKTNYINEIINSLNMHKINYKDFGVVNDSITNLSEILEPEYNFITRGGTKFIQILQNIKENQLNLNAIDNNLTIEILNNSKIYIDKLINSVDYDIEKFDQNYYKNLNLPLLNNNAKYYSYDEIKNYSFEKSFFIKPSRDLKSFNGGIIYPNETLENYIYRNGFMKSIENEIIVVSELQKIYSEYRFFMHKDKILSSSRYMINGKVEPSEIVPKYMKDIAIEYSKLYNPNDLYVIDLAETDKGIKIVEYNCWNASGFYNCNIRDIIFQINEIKQ